LDAPASVTNHVEVEAAGDAEPDNDADDDPTTILAAPNCSYALNPGGMTFPASGGALTVNVTASGGSCAWTVSNSISWVTLTSPPSGSGNGTLSFTVAANTGAARLGSLTIAGINFLVQQTGASVGGARFVPVAPCRVADTRAATGAFGGPSMDDDSTRSFRVPQSGCGIPTTAQAYSLNVTVVPKGSLSYLTLYPTGQPKPLVSTLNSFGGDVVANAAIVPAGLNGEVSVYASNSTDVILDIDGYFDTPSGSTSSFSFYPASPCRVADTRNPAGSLGGPALVAGQTRDFPVPASGCGMPATAAAYSLNVTAVPNAVSQYLGYLTIWPTGQTRPNASTLNSWDGRIVANAAIVPAGTSGSVSVFVPNPADVVLDANGYFAAPGGPGALTFYPVAPCRVADTRNATGAFGGPIMNAATSRSFPVPASGCFVPSNALAYSVNVTVVPQVSLSYLTIWPTGTTQPYVSTLNSPDGSVVANAAIVPAGTNGAISVYVTDRTHLILDINGYFAP